MASKNSTSDASLPDLLFSQTTPVAPRGLGGLKKDIFSNGRIYATVGDHGGILGIGYWGKQHLGAPNFFSGSLETAWVKTFRPCVGIGKDRYYIPFRDSKLYPFGISGSSDVQGLQFKSDLLLLPDALVQRFSVKSNPKKIPLLLEIFHQERIAAVNISNRTWTPFKFDAEANALIASCTDRNFEVYTGGDNSLAQHGLGIRLKDAPKNTTWIGLGCDVPCKAKIARERFKIYFTSKEFHNSGAAFYLVFAQSREALIKRLAQLSKSVHKECDALISGYEKRLDSRPKINVGNAVLNSAFTQFPEIIQAAKIPDQPGATRANITEYFVWGWDGMTPCASSPLANEAEYSANILRFFQKIFHKKHGIPHQVTTANELRLKGPYPSQAQYITGLYHYVSITGDLKLVREVLPTCRKILDLCRKNEVKGSGLVSGHALWPDFPEEMGEDGYDIAAMNNSLLYQGLRAMEFLAGTVGDTALVKECADWAKRLKASFIKYLYDEEWGYFITSCSSKNFKPRKHYGCAVIFWLTPFARELVAHAPKRIADFMDKHLRSRKCLLSLPHWDTSWMADGNQLGSSFPAADHLYLNLHKVVGNDFGLKAWMQDVAWYWQYHTAPEAFTPEATNEDLFGPDSHGGKQMQACTSWYAGVYTGIAGLDFDHEGLTVTPWGDVPVTISGLRLRNFSLDLRISGKGNHLASLKLNGKALPLTTRKIAWSAFKGGKASLEIVRTEKAPSHPIIMRADGLKVDILKSGNGAYEFSVQGRINGEIVVYAPGVKEVEVNGKMGKFSYDCDLLAVTIPYVSLSRTRVILK